MAIKVSGTEVISDDKRILNNESLPDIRPSLLLDFANSKTLDPRITFTRGSTATYWDGKTTAKAEENLLAYSQDMTLSPWSGAGTTRTANTATAPDGTTTANTIQITSEGPYRNVRAYPVGLPSTTYTASVYLKKSNYDYVRVNMQSRLSDTSFISAIASRAINLSNGATVGVDEGTATTTDVGNGWYRVTVSGTSASNAQIIFIDAQFVNSGGGGAPSPNIASGSEFYAWGAQLEQRSSATAYTATTSSPIVKYQPVLQTAASGEARFDHDPVTGESKGLLIEEARTNLIIDSDTLPPSDGGAGFRAEATPSISPDGSNNAESWTTTATTGQVYFFRNINMVSGTTYTYSIFVKAHSLSSSVTPRYVKISTQTQMPDKKVVFDLQEGTIVSGYDMPSASIVDTGNGWYRISATNTADTTGSGFGFILWPAIDSSGSVYINTNGTAGLPLFQTFGHQVEAGSFPTSYIPTSGSTVTRASDSAYIDGADFSNFYSAGQGTLYAEYLGSQDTFCGIAAFQSTFNTINSRISLLQVSAITAEALVLNSGTTQAQLAENTVVEGLLSKVVVSYVENDVGASFNNSVETTDTSATIPSDITALRIGGFSGGNSLNSTIKKIAYYPKRLPNATLQAMTEE